MNNISAYRSMSNLNIKEKSPVIDNTNVIDKDKINTSKNQDSDNIDIQSNKKAINTKKAYDALQETCKEFGTVECRGYTAGTMQYHLNTMMIIMKDKGISVPDFDISGGNVSNTNYLGFIDNIKDFTKNLSKKVPNLVPDNFFNFCDVWKEKLIQNGCS
ncbi:hypothetical protein [Clostridium cibarium]|uniref:Uncharacterized protein n=1 Tax=Clostridium cibarium TaxID=2762247 RepID=A0ABR8PZ67_9CLOT|nr:hypothetical protein [Clostridium cibarium]MBD7913467.1 hypothetical protein [Clostridium cibarium]